MRRYALSLAAGLLATAAVPSVAAAANAEVTTALNMRAGPATSFPVVEVLPDSADVTVHGCVNGYQWCDVTWQGVRGWVYADYLRYYYRERYVPLVEYAPVIDVPIIGFSVDTYWNSYYRDRPWYGRRARWRNVWRDRRNIREERRERRADRREDRRDAKQDRREAQQQQRRNRAERRERRREGRAQQRERRRGARVERRRDNRAVRQQRRARSAQRGERRDAGRGNQVRERGGSRSGGGRSGRGREG